ncbi:hypothetical protein VP01_5281g1, partial [Puccinia sorghi]
MSWPFFLNLLHLIKPDPIFYNQSQNNQKYVSIQLAIFTFCLGYNGNGSAIPRLKNLFQVGYGTVNLYTKKIIKILWFSPLNLKLTDNQFHSILFVISTRNSHPISGYPGSCHNSYLFSNMQIAQKPEKLFYKNQSLKNYFIKFSPLWKTQLIQSQISIEHAIDILKGIKEVKDTIRWIISCTVLHNLLADLKDQWNELYEEDGPDSAPVAEDNIDNSKMEYMASFTPILKNLNDSCH